MPITWANVHAVFNRFVCLFLLLGVIPTKTQASDGEGLSGRRVVVLHSTIY
jgi:hypothetical protein